MRPHRRQPTRLPCPWGSPGKNTGEGCHFLLQCMKVKSESEVAQSCPTLSMDCSPPGSSVHGIFQARALEWGANSSFVWAMHLRGEATQHGIPCPYFWTLQPMFAASSAQRVTGIPHDPQAQGSRVSSSRAQVADEETERGKRTSTANPDPIVNTASSVLFFVNLPQGAILTRAERHFEELKGTSLPLPFGTKTG